MRFRIFSISVLVTLAVSSCAVTGGGDNSSQIIIEIKNSPKVTMNPEIELASQALHHYLGGQLAYLDQDFTDALNHFSKASELVKGPAPTLHRRLAELYVRAGDMQSALREGEKAIGEEPDNVDTQFLYAGVLETIGRNNDAEVVYLELVRTNPENVNVYILLSNLYSKNRQYEKSLEVLNQFEKQFPDDPLTSYYRGHIYEKKLDLKSAEKYYLEAYKRGVKGSHVVGDLLRIYFAGNEIDKARELCVRVLKDDPGNLTARRVLSHLFLGESRYDEALEHLEVLKTVEEDAAESRFKIALIQIERQNYKEGIRELHFVLANNPQHTEARFYLASIYAARGRNKDALAELYKIEQGQKMFVKSRTFAAFIFRQEGDLENAEKAVREALEVQEGDKHIFSYLLMILRDAGKYDEAEEILIPALDKTPDDESLLFHYGVVLSDLKREDESQEKMKKVLGINPMHSDALNFMAYSMAENGDELTRALEMIQTALSQRPQDAYYIDTLGWIHYQMGNYDSAAKELARAVSLSGDDIVILEHYGDSLVKVGKVTKAMEIYRTTLEVGKDYEEDHTDDDKEVMVRVRKKLDALESRDSKLREEGQLGGKEENSVLNE